MHVTDPAAPTSGGLLSEPPPAVLLERRGHVAQIQLNRPENRNSMTPELLAAFADAVATVRSWADIRCVVVTGSGASFCAGADFRSQIQADVAHLSPAERSAAMYAPFLGLREVTVPVIAALQGHAVGGGFGLALMADIRIAASDAKFGANFARLGLHAGMAISYLLPRLVGAERACELLFTGRLFSGQEGAQMGLFLRAEPADRVLAVAHELAGTIARNAPIAVRMMKQSIYQGLDWDPRTAAWREAFAQAATVDTADAREGIAALLAKRDPEFAGS